jgi:hypothetical protein
LPACPTATHWLRGLCKQLVYHDYFADTCPGKAQIHKEFPQNTPWRGRGGGGVINNELINPFSAEWESLEVYPQATMRDAVLVPIPAKLRTIGKL